MKIAYTASISDYVPENQLPIYMESIMRGAHPQRHFHRHNFSELVLITEGSAEHIVGEYRFPVHAGDVLILHSGFAHGYDHTEEMALINLVYDSTRLPLPLLESGAHNFLSPFLPFGGEELAEAEVVQPVLHIDAALRKNYIEELHTLQRELRTFKPGHSFMCLSLFMRIIARLAREHAAKLPEQKPYFVTGDVIEYMNRHMSEKIVIDDLLKYVHMSRRNFFHCFKNATGCTPLEYLQRLRLQRALILLKQTELGLEEIASRCGFYDSNYFCKIFKSRMHMSPGRYRR